MPPAAVIGLRQGANLLGRESSPESGPLSRFQRTMYRKVAKNLCPLNLWRAEGRDPSCEALWQQAQPAATALWLWRHAAGGVRAPRPTERRQAAILQNQT